MIDVIPNASHWPTTTVGACRVFTNVALCDASSDVSRVPIEGRFLPLSGNDNGSHPNRSSASTGSDTCIK